MECTNCCLFKRQRMFFQHGPACSGKYCREFIFHSQYRIVSNSKHNQKINKPRQCSARNCEEIYLSLRCPISGFLNATFHHIIRVYISSWRHNRKGKVFSHSSKKEIWLCSHLLSLFVLRKQLLQKHKLIIQEKLLKFSGGAKVVMFGFGRRCKVLAETGPS